MDFLSALKKIEKDTSLWMRLKNSKEAYCIKDGHLCIVPSPKGAVPFFNTRISYILGEWEVLTPDEFYKDLEN